MSTRPFSSSSTIETGTRCSVTVAEIEEPWVSAEGKIETLIMLMRTSFAQSFKFFSIFLASAPKPGAHCFARKWSLLTALFPKRDQSEVSRITELRIHTIRGKPDSVIRGITVRLWPHAEQQKVRDEVLRTYRLGLDGLDG